MSPQSIRPFSFAELPASAASDARRDIACLGQLHLSVAAIAGGSTAPLSAILGWKPGDVIELDRSATEPVDLFVHRQLVGRGHIVIVDDVISVRVSEIVGDTSNLI